MTYYDFVYIYVKVDTFILDSEWNEEPTVMRTLFFFIVFLNEYTMKTKKVVIYPLFGGKFCPPDILFKISFNTILKGKNNL